MTHTRVVLADRYRLESRIAGGGVGEVWRAADLVLARPVAVKVLRPEYAQHPQTLARFRAEAKHAASVSHPGVAQVYDYGEDGTAASPYLVMELVDGPSLAGVLKAGPLDPGSTMDVLAQAAAGLQAAHAAGLVHRDVKPGNLLVGPGGQVKITDFGISRTAGPEPVTGTGTLLGTPAYLAPERLAGQAATPAGDLYSLGVVAWECLVGGCSAAIAAITDSTTGRRPVTCRNASSPSRGPRSDRLGSNSPPRAGDPSGSTHVQPASASRPVRSGSSSSQTCRNRGEQVVRLAELGDALALPVLPRRSGRRRRAFPVRLEHRDLVSVAREHGRRRQADHAAPAHHDRSHSITSPYSGTGTSCADTGASRCGR